MSFTPTQILNSELKKPWLLIASYDVSFDNYLNIQTRKERLQDLLPHITNELAKVETESKISMLEGNQKSISQNLRQLDEQIHDYIKDHQR